MPSHCAHWGTVQSLTEVELAGAELVEVRYMVASHMPLVVRVLDVVEMILLVVVVEVLLVGEGAVPDTARVLARMMARVDNFILAVAEGTRTESRGRELNEKGELDRTGEWHRCLV